MNRSKYEKSVQDLSKLIFARAHRDSFTYEHGCGRNGNEFVLVYPNDIPFNERKCKIKRALALIGEKLPNGQFLIYL